MMRLVLGVQLVNTDNTLSPFCNFPDGDQPLKAEYRPQVTVSVEQVPKATEFWLGWDQWEEGSK